MFRIIALLFVLLASPAYAVNELKGQPLSQVDEMAKKHGAAIEKLSDADAATMDAKTDPRPKPSTIYLLTLGHSVIIALVHEDAVIFSSNPIELETINRVLDRTGA